MLSGMISTPQSRLFLAALLALVITLASANFAIHAPALDIPFVPDENGHVLINNIKLGSANEEFVSAGSQITHINHTRLNASLLIEEPDQLGSWQAYNSFPSLNHFKVWQKIKVFIKAVPVFSAACKAYYAGKHFTIP